MYLTNCCPEPLRRLDARLPQNRRIAPYYLEGTATSIHGSLQNISEKGKTFESLPPKRGEMQNKIVVCAMLNMDLQPDEKSSLRQYKLQITQALFQYPKEN
jgi:hypothetical protein